MRTVLVSNGNTSMSLILTSAHQKSDKLMKDEKDNFSDGNTVNMLR